ncbi:MAG: hypothetical protein ACK4Z5_05010 [Brevundimonas sp.]
MTDALSAASLLLAMIALIFGAWWPKLTFAAEFEFSESEGNRPEQRRPIRATLFGQAIPLTIGAVVAALIFAPRTLKLMQDAIACGCPSPARLNDVAAAFVVSEILLWTIAVALIVQTSRISVNLFKARKKKP